MNVIMCLPHRMGRTSQRVERERKLPDRLGSQDRSGVVGGLEQARQHESSHAHRDVACRSAFSHPVNHEGCLPSQRRASAKILDGIAAASQPTRMA
jgi:hypothetical protein